MKNYAIILNDEIVHKYKAEAPLSFGGKWGSNEAVHKVIPSTVQYDYAELKSGKIANATGTLDKLKEIKKAEAMANYKAVVKSKYDTIDQVVMQSQLSRLVDKKLNGDTLTTAETNQYTEIQTKQSQIESLYNQAETHCTAIDKLTSISSASSYDTTISNV